MREVEIKKEQLDNSISPWFEYQMTKASFSEEKKERYKKIFEIFSNQGHSGFSASYTIGCIRGIKDNLQVEIDKLNKDISNDTNVISNYNKKLSVAIGIKKIKEIVSERRDICYSNRMSNDIYVIIDKFIELNFTQDEISECLRLLDFKSIVPINGDEDEWTYVGDGMEQNKICSAIFRYNHDNSTATYLYGVSISYDGGNNFWTTGGGDINDINDAKIRSEIKVEFPFEVPEQSERFYVRELLNGDRIEADEEYIKYMYDLSRECMNQDLYQLHTFKDTFDDIKECEEFTSVNPDLPVLKIVRGSNTRIKIINENGNDEILLDDRYRFVNTRKYVNKSESLSQMGYKAAKEFYKKYTNKNYKEPEVESESCEYL